MAKPRTADRSIEAPRAQLPLYIEAPRWDAPPKRATQASSPRGSVEVGPLTESDLGELGVGDVDDGFRV
ncbi:MAG: hypothetical protein EP330_14335 [Deltaproteobacteria bacterium]|nr:MAG: hypothetical protein EP330_14335 [Deltaproteobacteria bacterium]